MTAAHPSFRAPYAEDDGALVRRFVAATDLGEAAERRIDKRATALIDAIRKQGGTTGALEDFLREYGLSTPEGLALMVLAEALLRVPDAATQDRLIEDKIAAGHWSEHDGDAGSWLISASTWALGITSRIVSPGETPDGLVRGLVRRIGQTAVRGAVRQAMRFLGDHFVLGETIEAALRRARGPEAEGYLFSYDMLGEGARTAADAARYFDAYARAIEAIGRAAADRMAAQRPGISVKLSALHPRFAPLQRRRVLAELVPRLLDLARAARAHDLGLTVDAEEADRLELSLEVIAAVAADPSLAGWDGYGFAVQAYQKRAPAVIGWAEELARATGRRLTLRLVKGAYWDTEVKRAQERGLSDYPVYSRKPATDLCYLACTRLLLAARRRLYPQFAGHNALTVATILEMAADRQGFEFQRLHGMGETLFATLHDEAPDLPIRIYAPVGGHRDLLAYLVRRLLENGANSSFVAVAGDPDIPVAALLERPAAKLAGGDRARHPAIPLPPDLYRPQRVNSRGIEFGDRDAVEDLRAAIAAAPDPAEPAAPLIDGVAGAGTARSVLNPADGAPVGEVLEAGPALAATAVAAAAAGFPAWAATPVEARAACLDRMADRLEAERPRFLRLLQREGGKTIDDALAELREAVDFCRYYAAEGRRRFGAPLVLPGPTGEHDALAWRGRGVFACIAPWNFPLSIFLGQVAAALVAGNSVVAKPAEQTPLIAAAAVRLLHDCGVPATALHLLTGDGTAGAALVAAPQIAGVAFTGSTEVGRAINRSLAGKDGPIVPLIAETGGINAMIVDATALPEQVADDVTVSAFRSAGQRCSALRLLCLQEDVADRMLAMIEGAAAELAVGDPADFAVDVGPVIDAAARQALLQHVEAMRRASYARVRFAGSLQAAPAGGTYVAPHVIELDAPTRLRQEVFGPILHVVRWRPDRLDELVDAIAATGYGLTLGIHSRIDGRVAGIVGRLPVGNVYVNRSIIGAVVGTQPFGGSGLSGTGPKAGGPDYLLRFAQEQVIANNVAAVGGNADLIGLRDA